MMHTFVLFSVMVFVVGVCEANYPAVKTNGRQKRLLFYDEEGNLVKTYKNPYLYGFPQKDSQLVSNSLSPFFNLLRPAFFGAYMIPVSAEVINQYSSDPFYQKKLLTLPRKDLVMEPNPLCSGLRTQLPSKECGKFWNCWDGWAFEQDCPEGLVFSSDGFCDYPHNVDCSKRFMDPLPPLSSQQSSALPSQSSINPSEPMNQPQQGTKPSSQAPQLQIKPIEPIQIENQPSYPEIQQSNPENKPSYSENQPPSPENKPTYPEIQPSNPENKPSYSENQPPSSGNKPSYPGNQPSQFPNQPSYPSMSQSIAPPLPFPPAIQSPCNKDYQAFRNEKECSEFFVCVDSVPIKFKCPADLLYNENIGVCDYPYRVECKVSEDSKAKPAAPCASPANQESPGVVTSSRDAWKSAPLSLVQPGSDFRSNVESNAVFFSQNWTSSHVAMSRQDAVRQLKLGAVARVSS